MGQFCGVAERAIETEIDTKKGIKKKVGKLDGFIPQDINHHIPTT